jgi:sugar diacid utilization regulator
VGSTALAPVDQGVFQGGRLVLTLRLVVERSIAEAEERAGRELFSDALQGRGGARSARTLARHLGYRGRPGPAVVLATRIRATVGDPAHRVEAAARRAAARELSGAATRALVGSLDEEVAAILRPEGADALARQIIDHVGRVAPGVTIEVGISDAREDLTTLDAAGREAASAALLAGRIGAAVLNFADLGLYKLMFDTSYGERVEQHVERWIGPLVRYDAEHGTPLCATLREVLGGASQAEAADSLSIHVSTLKYRLDRIREVLADDFREPEARFNIELALRLRESMKALGAPVDTGPADSFQRE